METDLASENEYGVRLDRPLSFSKTKRLLTGKQFKAVLARKLWAGDKLLTVCMAENDCGCPRLGVAVGKACGGAIVRNRLKRLLREAFRHVQFQLPRDFDYVVMISPGFLKATNEGKTNKKVTQKLKYKQIETSLLTLAAGIVKKIK